MKIRITESDIHMMVMEAVKRVLNESMLGEDITVSKPKKGAEPVNIMVGRFQPFTNGHIECLKQAMQKTGCKSIIFVSHGDPNPKKNKPIYGELQDEMLNRVKNAHSDVIADIVYGNGAAIDKNVAIAREKGYEPISWVTGQDHEAAYEGMVVRYGKQINLNPNFKMTILDRDPDADDVTGVSATKVREAIINGDQEMFASMVPNELQDLFDAFRQMLVK